MVHAGDLLVMGHIPQQLFDELATQALLKKVGGHTKGETLDSVGSNCDIICIFASKNDVGPLLEENGLGNTKLANTPGIGQLQVVMGASQLDAGAPKLCGLSVGKLMWRIPIRSDKNHAAKEARRSLQSLTLG